MTMRSLGVINANALTCWQPVEITVHVYQPEYWEGKLQRREPNNPFSSPWVGMKGKNAPFRKLALNRIRAWNNVAFERMGKIVRAGGWNTCRLLDERKTHGCITFTFAAVGQGGFAPTVGRCLGLLAAWENELRCLPREVRLDCGWIAWGAQPGPELSMQPRPNDPVPAPVGEV